MTAQSKKKRMAKLDRNGDKRSDVKVVKSKAATKKMPIKKGKRVNPLVAG